MSASSAISMVNESLRNLLIGEMRLKPEVNVTILAPDELQGERRINLFLYKVQENPILKNMDWQVKRSEPTQLAPPPLSLNLFYLITPYAKNDELIGNSTAHEILGEVMRVFYENPIVPEEYLAVGLRDAREQIKIMLNSLNLEELSNVWNTFSVPFRLSVPYEVSVVQIEMLSEHERIMAKRVKEIGVPKIYVPFIPPSVENIEPGSGAAGSTITVQGNNLTGWRAYIWIMGRRIVDAQELTNDTFQVTIPTDLSSGFYELRIDISHLFRRTFFFEVTP